MNREENPYNMWIRTLCVMGNYKNDFGKVFSPFGKIFLNTSKGFSI